jgi:two-component system, chemotaxis family, protein-glutamate methylesterase/glutaminase
VSADTRHARQTSSGSGGPEPPRPFVVIGASLGGLPAIRTILGAIPPQFPGSIVVVQHREKDADGGLRDLLQKETAMPVREVEDKEPIAAGTVYLAPPNYHLLVERGHFALSTEASVSYARPSIDVLFESAAEAYGDRVIGIILTGANQDGAAGLAALKQRGGLAVVQSPASAEARSMPDAALAAVAVDRILPLEAIGPFVAAQALREGR